MNGNDPNKDDWDEVYKQNYRGQLLAPHIWIYQAENLWEVAEMMAPQVTAVWDSFKDAVKGKGTTKSDAVIMIHFMLVAFCIENLLKASLVIKYHHALALEFKQKGALPKILRSHKLIELAKESGFVPSAEDEDVLRRLTRASVWAGRYPLPISYKELAGSEVFLDGKRWSVSHKWGDDVERFRNVVARIRSSLNLRPVKVS